MLGLCGLSPTARRLGTTPPPAEILPRTKDALVFSCVHRRAWILGEPPDPLTVSAGVFSGLFAFAIPSYRFLGCRWHGREEATF